MLKRRFRYLRFAWLAVLVGLVLFAIRPVRETGLRAAGRLLVVDEPLIHADVIVLALDAGGAGALEAADLVHAGFAPRVAVFADPPDAEDQEFIRRGLPYEDGAARSIRQLTSLGVVNVERIPRAVTGTEAEGDVLPDWCDQRRFRTVIVVTTADHSRRIRRVLRRAMKDRQTTVAIRCARFSSFSSERWWQNRGSARLGIVEMEKLLLDVMRHPLS